MGQAKKDPGKLQEAEAVKKQVKDRRTAWRSWSSRRRSWRPSSTTICC